MGSLEPSEGESEREGGKEGRGRERGREGGREREDIKIINQHNYKSNTVI